MGTSCFGELVILSSKAMKGVAIGGGARLALSLGVDDKSKIWSNSVCWSPTRSSSTEGCLRVPESRRQVSFFLRSRKTHWLFIKNNYVTATYAFMIFSWFLASSVMLISTMPFSRLPPSSSSLEFTGSWLLLFTRWAAMSPRRSGFVGSPEGSRLECERPSTPLASSSLFLVIVEGSYKES